MKAPSPSAGGDCPIQGGMSLYSAVCWTSFHSRRPWLWQICRRVISSCKSGLGVLPPRHEETGGGRGSTCGRIGRWNKTFWPWLGPFNWPRYMWPVWPECRSFLPLINNESGSVSGFGQHNGWPAWLKALLNKQLHPKSLTRSSMLAFLLLIIQHFINSPLLSN